MSITKSRLRQIIKEEVTRAGRLLEMSGGPLDDPSAGEDPIAAARGKYDRLQGVRSKYARGGGMGGGLGNVMRYGDKLTVMADIALDALADMGIVPEEVMSASPTILQRAYDTFHRNVMRHFEQPSPVDPRFPRYTPPPKSGINSTALSTFWNAWLNADCDLDTLRADYAAMQELEAEFETADVSDETDSMYGRKSYSTRHKGTGSAMGPSWRDREGSLGG